MEFDDLIDVTMFGDTTRRFLNPRTGKTTGGSQPPEPALWPFGTIVRPKDDPHDPRRLLVVRDNGNPSFSAVVVRAMRGDVAAGSVGHYWARNLWEPEPK